MKTSVRHNPLNDLGIESVESAETMRRSEQLIQTILQHIELRQDKHLRKAIDTLHPVILHDVAYRDVQDEAQD